MLLLVLITRVPQLGAPKGAPSIGKPLAPCYGFTENVHISSPSGFFITTKGSWIDSRLWGDYSQVR